MTEGTPRASLLAMSADTAQETPLVTPKVRQTAMPQATAEAIAKE
jgi:hypothetical protein